MKSWFMVLALAVAVTSVACNKSKNSVFEDTGKKMDNGIHNAGENVDKNLNKAGEKVKDVTH